MEVTTKVGRLMMEATPKRLIKNKQRWRLHQKSTNGGVLLPGWLLLSVVASDAGVTVTISDWGGLYS
jgi:hypothetical protein